MMEWFARRARDASKRAKDDQGFTLIELLVVVIIIGILAAIAIPAFLSQRDNARQASVESDARNAATAVQSWGTERGGDYSGVGAAAAITEIEGNIEWSTGNGWGAGPASVDGGNGFSFTVTGQAGTNPVTYDSTQGGIQ